MAQEIAANLSQPCRHGTDGCICNYDVNMVA